MPDKIRKNLREFDEKNTLNLIRIKGKIWKVIKNELDNLRCFKI
jgi:hypothetical protein